MRVLEYNYYLAEGVGFEPTVRLPVRLISSQVPLTTQPPFQVRSQEYFAQVCGTGKLIRRLGKSTGRLPACKKEGAGGQNSPAPMLGVGRTSFSLMKSQPHLRNFVKDGSETSR